MDWTDIRIGKPGKEVCSGQISFVSKLVGLTHPSMAV
jgi:hypothetical protein